MHEGSHPTQHPLRMVNEPDELPQIRLSAQIDHSLEAGMMVSLPADLHELNLVAESIDDLLVTPGCPTI